MSVEEVVADSIPEVVREILEDDKEQVNSITQVSDSSDVATGSEEEVTLDELLTDKETTTKESVTDTVSTAEPESTPPIVPTVIVEEPTVTEESKTVGDAASEEPTIHVSTPTNAASTLINEPVAQASTRSQQVRTDISSTRAVSKVFTTYPTDHDGVQLDNCYSFSNLLDDKMIARIKAWAETTKLKDGTIGGAKTTVTKSYRNSKICIIPMTKEWEDLYHWVELHARKANNELWGFQIAGYSQGLQFGEYSADYEGHYDWHLDCGSASSATRKISVTIQLSDTEDYEGGDLQFQTGRVPTTASKSKGLAIYFPSFHLHRVKPVTKGTRYSLVAWFVGKPLC